MANTTTPIKYDTTNLKRRSIIVRKRDGSLENAYCPNDPEHTAEEWYQIALKEAEKIGGYVTR